MTSLGDFRIPITVHLHVHTVRAIQAAAGRASVAAGREVTVRELIEQRVEAAVVGVHIPGAPRRQRPAPRKRAASNGLSTEAQHAIRVLSEEGMSAVDVAAEVGCSRQTVMNYRKRFRESETGGRDV